MEYTVYMHENKINHKKYIGITSQKPKYRWGQNGEHYKECPLFWNAIQKYGWDTFEHYILFTGLTADEASRKEIELIAQYNSADPAYGYNLSKGGFGLNSDSLKELWRDDTFKAYMCECMRQAWTDPDKKLRRSNSAKQRWRNPDYKHKVSESIKCACGSSVICVETGHIYKNICDVENELGLNHSNICRAIKTGYKCGNYHWKYIEDNVS